MYFYTLDKNFPIEQLPAYFFDENGDFVYPETYTQEEIDNFPEDFMPQTDTHLEWIMTIRGNLQSMFRKRTDVYVAGDIYWYAEKENPGIRIAPDVMVAFGRPKVPLRDSYKQWEEEDTAPQVVFEIISRSNTKQEMLDKFAFYQSYGVEEYYVYNPKKNTFYAWHRKNDKLTMQLCMPDVVSPLLGIRLEVRSDTLKIYRPEGMEFLTYVEIDAEAEKEREARQKAEKEAEAEKEARQKAEEARQKAEKEAEEEKEARQKAEEAQKQAEQKAQADREARQKAEKEAQAAKEEEERMLLEYRQLVEIMKGQGFDIERYF